LKKTLFDQLYREK